MDVVVGNKRIEIDVGELLRKIDKAFHEEITDKTGFIIRHNDIVLFISDVISEHNAEELAEWYENMQMKAEFAEEEKKIDRKMKAGKVVKGTDSMVDKFKCMFLGYIDIGKGDGDE